MPRVLASKRHAEALFELAWERGKGDEVLKGLRRFGDALSHPLFLSFMESPRIDIGEKERAIKRLIPDIDELLLKFLLLLISRGRIKLLPSIITEYERLINKKKGIEYAEVITAIPLDEDLERRIKEKLSSLFAKEVYLSKKVDPSLIGGFIVRVGDKLLDGSIRMRLEEMRRSLIRG